MSAREMTTEQQTTGFAPGSVYASWSEVERAASDRIERDGNARRGVVLAHAHFGTIRSLHDDALRRMAKTYARQLEDADDGTRTMPPARRRATVAKLTDVHREQEFRAALAASWLASDTGTHSYSAFDARGRLDAVVHHGAIPPSYDLAVTLDHEHYVRGLPHVLDWAASEPKAVAA